MLQDLVFALRELRKRPGLAVTAVLSLTLGIGATTAVFSVIYGLLVDPYPYLAADRMIDLSILNEKGDRRGIGITGLQLKALQQVSCIESAAILRGGRCHWWVRKAACTNLYSCEWVVYTRPLRSRYTHRVAISNRRIVKVAGGITDTATRIEKDASGW